MSAVAALEEDAYLAALRSYLGADGEGVLDTAYELGRRAQRSGLGVVELSTRHHEALEALASSAPDAPSTRESARRAGRFLSEALAPFEMALRGFSEANGRLRELASTLEQRVVERTQQLSKTEARLRSLVEQLPAVTYLADPHQLGVFTYVSPQMQSLLGFTPEDWLAREGVWMAQMHPDDRGHVRASLEALEGSMAPAEVEYRITNSRGEQIWVRDRSVTLRDPDGQLLARQGILLDVTEQRRLAEQVRQSQKMETVGLLAGSVAHDFNNLLSVILTFAQLDEGLLPEGHQVREDLAEIRMAATRAAGLTRQLLSFCRRQTVEPTLVQPHTVVKQMEGMLKRLMGVHVEIVFHLQAAVGEVRIDPGQLEQVVMNLMVNARDAMPSGGTIEVATEDIGIIASGVFPLGVPNGEYVVLAVRDTGAGMSEATRARLFEPFFTTKEVGKGTGLGLATCHSIVKDAGGRITVESELGRGSTFRVFLPRASEGSAASAPKPEAALPRGAGERVLLVEDETSVREAATAALTRLGYQVVAASRASEALLLLQEEGASIQLLFSDIVLPGTSGLELAHHACELRPGLRVLLASGYTHAPLGGAGMKGIQKPYTLAALATKVREVLDAQA